MAKILITGGNFQDAAGNPIAFGIVTFRLNTDAMAGDSQISAGRIVTFNLDANGNLSGYIWPNDQMAPNNTVYFAKAYAADGQLVWESEFYITSPSWAIEEIEGTDGV
jgi:hypothetical protein